MSKITALPDKPSDLIDLALRDLETVENSKKYLVDMGTWHQANHSSDPWSLCAVCFAGSVMAQSLGVVPDKNYLPADFPPFICCKLEALNSFRCGWIHEGLREMEIYFDGDDIEDFFSVRPYDDSHDGFKTDMRELAAMLRKKGL